MHLDFYLLDAYRKSWRATKRLYRYMTTAMFMRGILMAAGISLSTAAHGHAISGEFELLTAEGKVIESFALHKDGSVTGKTAIAGACSGSYSLTWDGFLNITYDGMQGPGTTGGCHNASSRIDIGETKPDSLSIGNTAFVISRSQMEYGAPRNLVLKRVR